MNRPRIPTADERTRTILEDLEAVRENLLARSDDIWMAIDHNDGFILDGQGTTGITTWRRLYEILCQQLLRKSPERFRALPENPDFISNRGHRSFTHEATELRSATPIGDGIHAEINLSANALRDMIRRLLVAFEIPTDRLMVFLRQDRDAAKSEVV